MITHLSALAPSDQPTFASTIFQAQIALQTLLLLLVLPILPLFDVSLRNVTIIGLIVSAALFLSSKEYLIRYAFSSNRERLALLLPNVASALLIVSILSLDFPIDSEIDALIIYTLSYLIAFVVALLIEKSMAKRADLSHLTWSLTKDGLWSSSSALVYSFRTAVPTYVAAILLDSSDLGNLNAARTFVAPVTLLIPTLSIISLPTLSTLAASHKSSNLFHRKLHSYILILLCSSVSYAIALCISAPQLEYFVGTQFQDAVSSYLLFWSLHAVTICLRCALEWGLQAKHQFAYLLSVNLISTVVTLLLSIALTIYHGAIGCIIGAAIGELLVCVILLFRLRALKTEGA